MINQPAVQSRPFFYDIFAVVALLALMLVFSFLGTVASFLVADGPVALGGRTSSVAILRLRLFLAYQDFLEIWR